MNASQRRTVYFGGRVQGVGFRYTTCSVARGHDVSGTVRNLPDGRVELIVEGRPAQLDAFLDELRDRMSPYIRNEHSDVGAATGEFTSFDVRH